MRILFVKLSSIGDIVHTLPVLAAAKRALPESDISWAVERNSAEILRNNPMLFDLIEVDIRALKGKKNLPGKTLETVRTQIRKLRSSEFDLTIDFQGLFKSASVARLAKTNRRFGFSKRNLREPASRVLFDSPIDVEPMQNVILKNLELAERTLRYFLNNSDFHLDKKNLEFPIETGASHKKEADDIARRAGGKFAILNPAGGWVTKRWHAEKYGRLADLLRDKLGMSSVITTGPGELELAETAIAASKSAMPQIAQPSLKGFVELARRAAVYVGADTAPTHLAVAVDCPVVGIFGPTEWWRNGSINPDDICVERNDIECRFDCHRRQCDKWICMDIDVETAFAAVSERLTKHGQI